MTTLNHVIQQLQGEGRLQADPADLAAALAGEGPASPWYLRLMVALSAWFATLLLLIFVALTGLISSEEEAVAVGVILLPVAVVLARQSRGEFMAQAALALSLTGQVLVVGGLWLLTDSVPLATLLGMGLAGVLVYQWPDFLGRLLATLLGVGAVAALIVHLKVWWLVHPFFWTLAAATAWLWLGRRLGPVGAPLAYGLALGLLGLLAPSLWPGLPWPRPWLTGLGLGPVLLGVAWRLTEGHRHWLPILVGGGLFWLLALPAPGLVAAALVVLLGFGRGERPLTGLGLAFLVVFLGGWYYQLDWTLLAKAGVLVAAGSVLLGVRRVWLGAGPSPILAPAGNDRWRSLLLGAGLVLVLGSVNHLILQAERTLARGQPLLLELAPVDPRSLIQGDYMVLDYALARQAVERVPEPVADGRLVVRVDEQNVARLVGLDGGRPLEADQRLLAFRKRGDWLRLGPNAFFFQEGMAQTYQAARYGEFRVTPGGRALLVGLRDEDLRLLDPEPVVDP